MAASARTQLCIIILYSTQLYWLSHLSMMKLPGRLWVICSSHWHSVSATAVHVLIAEMLLPPQSQLGVSLFKVMRPLCCIHCPDFLFKALDWNESKLLTCYKAWYKMTMTSRSAVGICRCTECANSWVHSKMSCHSHTYIFMSSYPPHPIVEKKLFPSQKGRLTPVKTLSLSLFFEGLCWLSTQ